MRKQILLIDDDLPLCRKLREALQDDTGISLTQRRPWTVLCGTGIVWLS